MKMALKALNHGTLERNVGLLGLLALLVVTIGGIVEIAPLFWIDSTIEPMGEMNILDKNAQPDFEISDA
jgi:cytochrome c oxidase cbb3-type subunit 2